MGGKKHKKNVNAFSKSKAFIEKKKKKVRDCSKISELQQNVFF